jgi:photosystem I reaction center subunit V
MQMTVSTSKGDDTAVREHLSLLRNVKRHFVRQIICMMKTACRQRPYIHASNSCTAVSSKPESALRPPDNGHAAAEQQAEDSAVKEAVASSPEFQSKSSWYCRRHGRSQDFHRFAHVLKNSGTRRRRNVSRKFWFSAFFPFLWTLSGGATLASLALGRFVALPYQRAQSAKQVPKQNGVDHVSAGDNRAKEVGPLVSSRNDPASFKLVGSLTASSPFHTIISPHYVLPRASADVLAWGSIGHLVGFTALVLANNP